MPRGRPFQKGQNGGAKGGARPGAGRPTEAHRAECRRLVEEGKIHQFFQDVVKGQKVDFSVTLAGKVIQVPASVRNRLVAGITLLEHGFGKAPQEHTHRIDPETLELFEKRLLAVFQKYFPKSCTHCRTAIAMPAGIAQEILELSKIFEVAEEAAKAEA